MRPVIRACVSGHRSSRYGLAVRRPTARELKSAHRDRRWKAIRMWSPVSMTRAAALGWPPILTESCRPLVHRSCAFRADDRPRRQRPLPLEAAVAKRRRQWQVSPRPCQSLPTHPGPSAPDSSSRSAEGLLSGRSRPKPVVADGTSNGSFRQNMPSIPLTYYCSDIRNLGSAQWRTFGRVISGMRNLHIRWGCRLPQSALHSPADLDCRLAGRSTFARH
jgi:hypothetical protein